MADANAWKFAFNHYFEHHEEWPTHATALSEWEDEVKILYFDNLQCIIHNISPPGAGKTHLWEREIFEEER